jgi:hypothetical protein
MAAFAKVALKAARDGTWNAQEVYDGLEIFLNYLIRSDPALQVPQSLAGLYNHGDEAANTKLEIMNSPEWAQYMRKLDRITAKRPAPPASGVRLLGIVSNRDSARRMERYIKDHGMTLTEFATKAQTTDRTLRSFRNTGKIRKNIFGEIAKTMGMTKEELLKR